MNDERSSPSRADSAVAAVSRSLQPKHQRENWRVIRGKPSCRVAVLGHFARSKTHSSTGSLQSIMTTGGVGDSRPGMRFALKAKRPTLCSQNARKSSPASLDCHVMVQYLYGVMSSTQLGIWFHRVKETQWFTLEHDVAGHFRSGLKP